MAFRGMAILLLVSNAWALDAIENTYASQGRQDDGTSKTVSEIYEAQRRQVPIEVELSSSSEYPAGSPVSVTVMVTNLFDTPLLINRRMLINHPRLEGEVSFKILGPDGKTCEIQRLVTPMTLSDDDFVMLQRGQSIQRTVDLSDFYAMKYRGNYTVRAYYHNDQDHPEGSVRAWKGVVASDPVDIKLD